MNVSLEWVRYGADQEFLGCLATPPGATEKVPAVLVLQEIWGVDSHIQDVTRRYAEAGYVALAPDLFAVNGKRPPALENERVEAVKDFLENLPPTAWGNQQERDAAIDRLPAEEGARIRESLAAVFGGNREGYLGHILEAAKYLRESHPTTKGARVGSVGFCMGGALSAQLACNDPQLSGAVIYYGGAPSAEAIQNIQCDVIGFYGSLDTRLTEGVPQFAENMKAAGKNFEYQIYEGAHHAFFNDSRRSFHLQASRDAFARTLQFFREHLSE